MFPVEGGGNVECFESSPGLLRALFFFPLMNVARGVERYCADCRWVCCLRASYSLCSWSGVGQCSALLAAA